MDLDTIFKSLNEGALESGTEEADTKNMRLTNAVSKDFIVGLIAKLPEKVGKDVKARLASMKGQLTVEQVFNILCEIMAAGNMTQLVSLKDVPSLKK